jgi:hypothetical protein
MSNKLKDALLGVGTILLFLVIGCIFGFLISQASLHKVVVDDDVEGLITDIIELNPRGWSIEARSWDDRTFALNVNFKDVKFEFEDRKSISALKKDVANVKEYMNE